MTRSSDAADNLRAKGYANLATAAKAMYERDLDNAIRSLAEGLGLRRFHVWDSRNSPSGFPDLVLLGKRGLLFRELKVEGKNPTPAQQGWIDDLNAAGQNAGVWRPSDLLAGTVARELAAISGLEVRRGD